MTANATPQPVSFPWYDSPWLCAYVEARQILGERQPALLPEFEKALEVFQVPLGFQATQLPQLLSEDDHAMIKAVIAGLQEEDLELHEFMRFGRTIVHDLPQLHALQSSLVPLISEVVGEAVEASYSFLSLYNNLGVCEVHMDAPSAKWTLDICIDQSAPWPIHVAPPQPWPEVFPEFVGDWQAQIKSDVAPGFTEYTLTPRDALVFGGANQWHYRDRLPRVAEENFCHLLFFHYIPAGSSALVQPGNWAEIFGVPELSHLQDYDYGY